MRTYQRSLVTDVGQSLLFLDLQVFKVKDRYFENIKSSPTLLFFFEMENFLMLAA